MSEPAQFDHNTVNFQRRGIRPHRFRSQSRIILPEYRRSNPVVVVVVRNSLPFWNSVPHLTAAFVMRGVSHTTLARLRNILSRPQPDKTGALLFFSAQLVDLNPPRRA